MLNPNYRYVHLAKLIQVVNGPLPGMQAIRRIDQAFGTSYFNDIFHGHQWPLYIQWFGLEDHLTDIATDYAAEIYDAHDFENWLSRQKKVKGHEFAEFTPTQDPTLRTILSLDELENSWLFGITRTNLRRELSKNGFLHEPAYLRLGYDTRMNLTYALFARRQKFEKLYAYCIAQAILCELRLKLLALPQQAQFDPVPSDKLFAKKSTQSLLNDLRPSIIWSFGSESELWFSSETSTALEHIRAFVRNTTNHNWPVMSMVEKTLVHFLGGSPSSLLSLCAPVLSDTANFLLVSSKSN